MTKDEYRAALDTLGLSQARAAALLGVKPRTSERWAAGEVPITETAARLLRYLVHIGADPARVESILQCEKQP